MLWGCLEWALACNTWLPWVMQTAVAILGLGSPDTWPPCLRQAGLMPALLVQDMDQEVMHVFMHRLC